MKSAKLVINSDFDLSAKFDELRMLLEKFVSTKSRLSIMSTLLRTILDINQIFGIKLNINPLVPA